MNIHQSSIITLNPGRFVEAVDFLINKDSIFHNIVDTYGIPKVNYRKPGFATFLYLILEQQVSLASAAAVYRKLFADSGKITPEIFLSYTDRELKAFGFSRQKTEYCRLIAQSVKSEKLKLNSLAKLGDDEVRNILMQEKGIGKWTADNYLLFALRRADIWPRYDLALVKAVVELKRLRKTPDEKRFDKIAETWKPWRSVAARLLWHHYLSK
ncbi:MAG: DNA-3-methyladenine glycosylase 2 family protein [Ignavibacteria bacterium]|jgi:DNA-3-methyladenine glycosylase II